MAQSPCGGSSPTFDDGDAPTTVANLELWFDAAVGITLNSTDVSQWDDQSTNGFDLTQGTAADQPLYNSDGFGTNDLPSLTFTNTAEFLDLSGAAPLNGVFTSELEMFVVLQSLRDEDPPFASDNGYPVDFNDNSTSVTDANWPKTTGIISSRTATTATKSGGDPSADLSEPTLYGVRSAANIFVMRIDAADQKRFDTNTFDAGRTDYIRVGAAWDSPTGPAFRGDIAEIVVYSAILSPGDRRTVEDYLGQKYKLRYAV